MIITKLFCDFIRWILIIGATIFVVEWLWAVHWALGLVLAFPLFIIFLNVFGFLTLPLYVFTKEARIARKALKDIIDQGTEQQEDNKAD